MALQPSTSSSSSSPPPTDKKDLKYSDFMENENKHMSSPPASKPEQKRGTVPQLSSQWEIAFEELKFETEVGSGAYGHVFSGIWRESPVAIKVLKSQLSASEIQDFVAESEVMMYVVSPIRVHSIRKLRPHKNVVQLLGICSKPPNFCMVMEFLGGLWT